ncbi:sugar-binding protein [Pseudomonas fluorescens]|uniref:CBM-cenC domain-containing protein n=1 Tax=Pseudomonas fluorescens TaxID=294 RepID=A0A5E7E8E2_PSEFL|nr:sugar-binding protein [Pseudomonas fluorescens]VVO23005.1 hypothetical protein PS833_04358 [Pseudomonas fluorescens]VVP94962.1 hypothetical protein PS914_03485 [Pseudomonas fluorescens]
MSNRQLNAVPRLPSPEVAEAVAKILTLQKPDGASGITVKVARWRSIAQGQPTTLHVSGKNFDGSTMMLLVVDAEPVTQAETVAGWSRSINWELLQGLEHGSHLTFVFQAVIDENECACPTLFPPLSLEIQEPYEDRTTFSEGDGTDNWNGWMRGEASSDPRDLVVSRDQDGYSLFNKTYTMDSAGVVLKKNFQNLEVGRTYEFALNVRRWLGQHEAPVLSLNTGIQVVSPPTQITSIYSFVVLKGTFTACSSQMELQIVSHVATGLGNDYIIREIWVKSP